MSALIHFKGSLSKMTLDDMIIIKEASNKKKESKKTKDKQQHNFAKKLDDRLAEVNVYLFFS